MTLGYIRVYPCASVRIRAHPHIPMYILYPIARERVSAFGANRRVGGAPARIILAHDARIICHK